MRNHQRVRSSVFVALCAALALWPLYGEHLLASSRLVKRNGGDDPCPNQPYQNLDFGIALLASVEDSVIAQRFSVGANRLVEQVCVSWLHQSGGATDLQVEIYAANGPGGDPGARLRNVPINIESEQGVVKACAVNIGVFFPQGGDFYAAVRWNPNSNSFIAADDAPATPQQIIRLSDNGGSTWLLPPASPVVKSVGLGFSSVPFSAGAWDPVTVFTQTHAVETSGLVISNTLHAAALFNDYKLDAIAAAVGNPQAFDARPIPTPGAAPSFTLGDVGKVPGKDVYFNSILTGNFDVSALEWGALADNVITSTSTAVAFDSRVYLETDTAVVTDTATIGGRPWIQTIRDDANPSNRGIDYFQRAITGTWSLARQKPIPGLLGALDNTNRARIVSGIANPGYLSIFMVADGASSYDIRAYARADGVDSPIVDLVPNLPFQPFPSEATAVTLPGHDGAGGNDYVAYSFVDHGTLRVGAMQWRGTSIVPLGVITVAPLPASFSSIGMTPGASGWQAFVIHPNQSGNGVLSAIEFNDWLNTQDWLVRPLAGSGLSGNIGYSAVFTNTLPVAPFLPQILDGESRATGEQVADLVPRALPEHRFPMLGPPGLRYQAFRSVAAPCVKTAHSLCVSDRRFRIEARFRTPGGQSGVGQAVELTPDTGYFTFFDPDNVEIVLKVLDACGGAFDRFWVFAAGLTNVEVDLIVSDTATGLVKTYKNALQHPFSPIQDTGAFATCNAPTATFGPAPAVRALVDVRGDAAWAEAPAAAELPEWALEVLDAEAVGLARLDRPVERAGNCVPTATALCLNNGRFRVTAAWETRDGQTGNGNAVALTSDTGYFWFFDQNNVEIVTKVLNACGGTFNRYWVFAAGLTDVEVTLTVTDTMTNAVKTYFNPQRNPFQPVQDINAFATCP